MKNRNEFFEYVKENIRDYLPPHLENAQLSIYEWVRENDRKMHVLTIRLSEKDTFPNICLDGFYQCYQDGKELDACVGDVADVYIAYGGMEDAKEPGIIWDYEKVKDRLFIRLCDLQWNQDYLKDKVYTVHGDFAAAYYIAIYEDREKILKVPVTDVQGCHPCGTIKAACFNRLKCPLFRDAAWHRKGGKSAGRRSSISFHGDSYAVPDEHPEAIRGIPDPARRYPEACG